jgi:hypothetical protein
MLARSAYADCDAPVQQHFSSFAVNGCGVGPHTYTCGGGNYCWAAQYQCQARSPSDSVTATVSNIHTSGYSVGPYVNGTQYTSGGHAVVVAQKPQDACLFGGANASIDYTVTCCHSQASAPPPPPAAPAPPPPAPPPPQASHAPPPPPPPPPPCPTSAVVPKCAKDQTCSEIVVQGPLCLSSNGSVFVWISSIQSVPITPPTVATAMTLYLPNGQSWAMSWTPIPGSNGVPVWNATVPMATLRASVRDVPGTYSFSARSPSSPSSIVTVIKLTQ